MDEFQRRYLDEYFQKNKRSPQVALECLIAEIRFSKTGRYTQDSLAQQIMEIITAIMAGDSVFGDKTYAEAGQKSIMPEYWRPACKYMESQGITYKTVEKYLKKKVAEGS